MNPEQSIPLRSLPPHLYGMSLSRYARAAATTPGISTDRVVDGAAVVVDGVAAGVEEEVQEGVGEGVGGTVVRDSLGGDVLAGVVVGVGCTAAGGITTSEVGAGRAVDVGTPTVGTGVGGFADRGSAAQAQRATTPTVAALT